MSFQTRHILNRLFGFSSLSFKYLILSKMLTLILDGKIIVKWGTKVISTHSHFSVPFVGAPSNVATEDEDRRSFQSALASHVPTRRLVLRTLKRSVREPDLQENSGLRSVSRSGLDRDRASHRAAQSSLQSTRQLVPQVRLELQLNCYDFPKSILN